MDTFTFCPLTPLSRGWAYYWAYLEGAEEATLTEGLKICDLVQSSAEMPINFSGFPSANFQASRVKPAVEISHASSPPRCCRTPYSSRTGPGPTDFAWALHWTITS